MAYTPNEWKARQGTGLNRFQDQNGDFWEFTAAPAEITQVGTPFSADWMNHIEQELGSEGQPNGLATLGTDGKLEAGQVPEQYPNGIWFAENGNNEFPGLAYNGTALWLGGSALSGPHHTGSTTISAGGRDTAYVAVFPEEGDGTSYQIWHKGMTFKKLWSGSWGNGAITVPGFTDYHAFMIQLEVKTSSGGSTGVGTMVLAFKHPEWEMLRGCGGYRSAAGNFVMYLFAATTSGNTLTFVNCGEIYINNNTAIVDDKVIGIYGIL